MTTGSVVEDLAARLRAAPPRAGTTRVAAIDGPAGAGKTTLADRLAAVIDAPVVHMDDLYPGWDGLAAGPGKLREWVLEPLAGGRPARYRRYDWEAGAYAEWVDVPAAGALIVEGCGSGARAAAPYLSLLVWIDAPYQIRRVRGIGRDGETFRPYWDRWAAQERELFAAERTAERADVRVDGTVPHDGG